MGFNSAFKGLSFVVSVCLSVTPRGIIQLPLERFSFSFMIEYFSKSVEKFHVSFNSDSNKGTLR